MTSGTVAREACAGCGMCCRTIHLSEVDAYMKSAMKGRTSERYRLFEYTADPTSDHDIAFIMANLYPLTREEVLARNPHIATWREVIEKSGRNFEQDLDNNFYSCVQLDEETGLCRVHDNQPRMCSGYPFYGEKFVEQVLWYADDCYYKRYIPDDSGGE